jgi:hypothetical protein
MSILSRVKESQIGIFWLIYEQKIVLAIGLILVAAISFEAGFLHGQKNKQEPVIVNKAASIDIASANTGQSKTDKENTKTTPANSKPASTAPAATADNQKCAYVASKNSDKFHLPTCRYAQNIKTENKVCFSSKEEAESRGFQGAKCCIK